MDERLAGIIESSEPEQLASGFEFTEGPLWYSAGYWIFVDIRTSRIYKLVPGGEPEVIRENSDQSNGMTFDAQGRLLICEMESRQLNRWNDDGSFTSVASRWNDKRLNRPNDVICASDGSIYFTDPGLRMEPHEKEQTFNGVYHVAPDGTVTPVITDFEFPNGLALSPDERTLYVANSRPDMIIKAYDIQPTGSVTNGRVFADLKLEGQEGVPDGFKLDVEGRVYSTGPGGCWVFSPSGEHLGTIVLPEIPANCAFGGPDYKTLFFTARTGVYSVRTTTAGVKPPFAR
jgi:gluconolactonase